MKHSLRPKVFDDKQEAGAPVRLRVDGPDAARDVTRRNLRGHGANGDCAHLQHLGLELKELQNLHRGSRRKAPAPNISSFVSSNMRSGSVPLLLVASCY